MSERAYLGQVAEITMGQSPPGNTYNQVGVGAPLLNGPTDFGSKYPTPTVWTNAPTKMCGPNEILFCVRGSTTGRMNWSDREFCLGRGVAAIKAKSGYLDTVYIYYSLLNNLDRLLSNCVGSVFPNLSKSDVERFPIDWPSPAERIAVASFLTALDDKIELNRQMNKTLEDMAQALFKSWFVDFDPVRARTKGHNCLTPSDEVLAAFPERFEDSELGEVPMGWPVQEIQDLVEVYGGSTPSTKVPSFWEGGSFHWATPKDLSRTESPVLLDTERKITAKGLRQISSGLLPKGTLLMSSRAPIGYLAIAEIPVSVNQGFIAMVPKRHVSNHFMLRWCKWNMDVIKGRANGTTFQEISKSNFRPIRLVVPSKEAAALFDRAVSPIHAKVTMNLRESATLAALRDSLLPKLLSGELRVGEAERMVEGTL